MNTITIGNKEVKVRSSALTSELYRKLFNEDLLVEMSKAKKTSDSKALTMFRRLAFVMAWQAEERTVPISQAMKNLTEDDYFDWVSQFGDMDFNTAEVLNAITSCWLDNNKTLVDSKNLASLQ